MFRTAPRYKRLTASQFQLGYDWLGASGIVINGILVGGNRSRQLLFSKLVAALDPIWVSNDTSLTDLAHDLPLDLAQMAEELNLSVEAILDCLISVRRKFDAERLAAIGLDGEILLVQLLRARGAVEVNHLSLSDDTLGYDIRASRLGRTALIEVKATVGVADRFFLSRNEYETMLATDKWCLQLVHLADDGISSLTFATNEWLAAIAPIDASDGARWNSAYVTVPRRELGIGLHPAIQAMLGTPGTQS